MPKVNLGAVEFGPAVATLHRSTSPEEPAGLAQDRYYAQLDDLLQRLTTVQWHATRVGALTLRGRQAAPAKSVAHYVRYRQHALKVCSEKAEPSVRPHMRLDIFCQVLAAHVATPAPAGSLAAALADDERSRCGCLRWPVPSAANRARWTLIAAIKVLAAMRDELRGLDLNLRLRALSQRYETTWKNAVETLCRAELRGLSGDRKTLLQQRLAAYGLSEPTRRDAAEPPRAAIIAAIVDRITSVGGGAIAPNAVAPDLEVPLSDVASGITGPREEEGRSDSSLFPSNQFLTGYLAGVEPPRSRAQSSSSTLKAPSSNATLKTIRRSPACPWPVELPACDEELQVVNFSRLTTAVSETESQEVAVAPGESALVDAWEELRGRLHHAIEDLRASGTAAAGLESSGTPRPTLPGQNLPWSYVNPIAAQLETLTQAWRLALGNSASSSRQSPYRVRSDGEAVPTANARASSALDQTRARLAALDAAEDLPTQLAEVEQLLVREVLPQIWRLSAPAAMAATQPRTARYSLDAPRSDVPLPGALEGLEPIEAPHGGKQTDPGLRVLLIDDSAICRATGRAALKRLGFMGTNIHEASSGQQALELFQDNDYDLVVSDFHMENGDGADAVAGITQAARLQGRLRPYFIVASAAVHEEPASMERLVQAGSDVILRKPVTKELLQNTLSQKAPEIWRRLAQQDAVTSQQPVNPEKSP